MIMRRSAQVGSYRGRWSGVSGYLEDPTPLDQALREIREETGLTPERVRLKRIGSPMEVAAPEMGTLWVVHPFLFEIDDPESIQLDWENTEIRWVEPGDLGAYDTVPKLAEALGRCV
jgi:8-oxo-dGTP pyrophosphatase MutT (NUDIX family)